MMIGSGLRKFAEENGFRVEKGVAFGLYRGKYMVTLREGVGWKSVCFAVALQDDGAKYALHSLINDAEFKTKHRVVGCDLTSGTVRIVFHDTFGTMKRLREATDAVYEQLCSSEVKGADHCSHCMRPLDSMDAKTVLIGDDVLPIHRACFEELSAQAEENAEKAKQTGSILTGALGATLGALIGAIPWAIAYYFGIFVGWLGFLIGIAAKKGYEICKGRETRAKGIVMIVVLLLVVVFVEYATIICTSAIYILNDPSFAGTGLTFGDVFTAVNYTLATDSAALLSCLGDVLLGWLFAGLGVLSTLRDVFKRAKSAQSAPVEMD
ncbi:MAG: hypothetical protein Q4B99_02605 [Clostridia bacterium]|nr:hypothetical protein [Clostridia bacterium]